VQLDQLWRYDLDADNWILFSGNATDVAASTVYGILGQGTEHTYPGSRAHSAIWLDGPESIWVYGGYDENTGNY
jgi:hypothetical protein